MTPRYIIHVGPLKTASTYVQECLTASRADLETQGICYPSELLDPNTGFMHLPVFEALVRKDAESLRPAFARLNAAGHQTILLSCEMFIFLGREDFAALRDVTGATEIRVVYTCRRWSDRFTSIWNQTLFMGSSHSLPEFILSVQAAATPNSQAKRVPGIDRARDLEYNMTWRMLENVFGREGLQIFPYSVVMDRGEELFAAFCRDVLGLLSAPPTPFTGTRRWESLSTNDQEVLRMLNQIYLHDHAARTDEIRSQFMLRRAHYNTVRIVDEMAPYVTPLIIDDHNVLFDGPFERMSRFADRVLNSEVIFERKHKIAKYVQPGYLLRDGVREDLHRIYGQIQDDLRAPKN